MGLVLLALIFLPISIRVQLVDGVRLPYIFDPSGIDAEFKIGLLIAPVFGVWGLMGIVFGLLTSTLSRAKIVLSVIPAFALIYTGLAFTTWMVLNYSSIPFWWQYFSLFLVPSVIASITFILYLSKKEKLYKVLKNRKTIIGISCIIVLVPIIFSIAFWWALL